jgi:hypothetical protein
MAALRGRALRPPVSPLWKAAAVRPCPTQPLSWPHSSSLKYILYGGANTHGLMQYFNANLM